LRARLFLEGEQRTVVITTPWHLQEEQIAKSQIKPLADPSAKFPL